MKLLVRLYKDLPLAGRPQGIPGDWPAEVQEVEAAFKAPDGWVEMDSQAALDGYKQLRQSDYDSWWATQQLPLVKEAKFDAIDARTRTLIEDGFTYGSQKFSLSQAAQTTYTGLYAIRDEPLLTYPVKVNTADDGGLAFLTSAAEVKAFYLTAVGTYRAHLDAGTALKDKVRAALTIEEVEAVVDSR